MAARLHIDNQDHRKSESISAKRKAAKEKYFIENNQPSIEEMLYINGIIRSKIEKMKAGKLAERRKKSKKPTGEENQEGIEGKKAYNERK